MAEILHFWSDLTLIKIDPSSSSQVLSGSLQESDHFYSNNRDESVILVPLEVCGGLETQLVFKSRCLI